MESNKLKSPSGIFYVPVILLVLLTILSGDSRSIGNAAASNDAPIPLLKAGHPVDWWFVFKFNSKAFPGCGGSATRTCPFGGSVQNYKAFGQQFVYASSESASLQE